MCNLPELEVKRFFYFVYLYISLFWLYIVSVVLSALFADGILQLPNFTTHVTGNETDLTTATPSFMTTTMWNPNGTQPYEGQEFNPYPYIPSILLVAILPIVGTSIIIKHGNTQIQRMELAGKLIYSSGIVLLGLVELFLCLMAFMNETPILLRSIPLIIFFGFCFIASFVMGVMYCKDYGTGQGAMMLSLAVVFGGIFVPEIVIISLKLDASIDWRWDVVLIPFWILDIVLVFGGIILTDLLRQKSKDIWDGT